MVFQEYNRRFFGGVIHPDLPVHWKKLKHFGDSQDPCKRYPHGLIRLSTSSIAACGWRGILLHEMVHVYLDFHDVDEWQDGPVPWHGPRFVEEANRIGRELGLPEVTEETAWYWPTFAYDDHDPEPA